MPTSLEQLCRDILEQAIKERIVTFNEEEFDGTSEPQELTGGDCCGMANIIQQYIQNCRDNRRTELVWAGDQGFHSRFGVPITKEDTIKTEAGSFIAAEIDKQ